jgi:hypothetical protein
MATGQASTDEGRALVKSRGRRILRRVLAGALGSILASSGCASSRAVQERTSVGGVPFEQLDAEWVRQRTVVARRGDDLVFIAPELRLDQIVDPVHGGAPREGELGLHSIQSGYLFAEWGKGGAIHYYAVFQWNLVRGRSRYARVTLPDGRALRFNTGSTEPSDRGAASDFPVIDTLIVEIPEESLRLVPPSGLRLTITLDNGRDTSAASREPSTSAGARSDDIGGARHVAVLDRTEGTHPEVSASLVTARP